MPMRLDDEVLLLHHLIRSSLRRILVVLCIVVERIERLVL